MAQFVDWDLAAATAAALGKSGPAVSYEEAADAVADLKELADEAVQHVTAFTAMEAQVIAPPVRVVDRRDWAATNIDGLRQVINPLAERLTAGNTPGPLTAAIGSRFTGVQAGTTTIRLKFTKSGKKALKKLSKKRSRSVVLTSTVTDASGNASTIAKTAKIKP